ncbi:MAG: hypothetical protein ACAI38_23925 [Myxococcota bacterium]
MRPNVSIGEARALATLAFARAAEISGIDVLDDRALIDEYVKHRANVTAPKDFYDFQSRVVNGLTGQARRSLERYLDDPGVNQGTPTASISSVTARGQQILGFARGCEIGGLSGGPEAEALKHEYQQLRGDLSKAERADLDAFLKKHASPEAWAAMRS